MSVVEKLLIASFAVIGGLNLIAAAVLWNDNHLTVGITQVCVAMYAYLYFSLKANVEVTRQHQQRSRNQVNKQ